ncbi:MAG: DUF1295 domain-containing protein [Candidatus Omnitrophica bacterium]|nr:DUF1295 domain-containing protein [Candidatus Omnitrophota bacterium]
MASLREEFEKQGAWLFRWRSYLPFLSIPLVTYALTQSEYFGRSVGHVQQTLWEIFSISVSVIGFLIRCMTTGWAAKGTSGRNTHGQVAESLNTTGIYSVVRHPLYLGNFFLTLGFLLFTQVWWLVTISALAFWLYYERIMCAEEEFLRQKFGNAFLEWVNETPAFFPNFRKWKRPSTSFSWKWVLQREYSSLFGLISAFVLLKFFAELLGENEIELKPLPYVLLGIGFVIYSVLRFLSKKTKFLNINRPK